MIEMLLLCSAVILVVIGLRLLFRNHVSSVPIYSLWLPALAGLLIAPVAYLLTAASEFFGFSANVIYLVSLVWLAGAAALTTWLVLTERDLRGRLRKDAVPFTCPESPVPVWVSPHALTPCLLGLFRPAVYLTPDVAADPERCRHVLTHELTHWKHKDHIWSFARRFCLIIYWFHPLVWLAAQLSKQDSELACDEGALKRLGDEQRMAYGRTIVDLAAGVSSRTSGLQDRRISEELPERNTADKKYITATAGICLLLAAALLVAGSIFLIGVSGRPELQSISVVSVPGKTRYITGQTLDPQGLKLKLTYADGTARDITEGFTCNPTLLDTSGEQKITVTYHNQTTDFFVKVVDVKRMGQCGPQLEWILTTENDLIIEGSGPMDGYNTYDTPWGDYRERIRSVSLPEGLTSIGVDAFSGCEKLTEVKIPDSVTQIGEGAFYNCFSLTEITIPEGVEVIQSATFENCRSLKKVVLPTGLTLIKIYAFGYCTALSEVNIPNTVTRMEPYAFYACNSLPKETTIIIEKYN